MSQLYPTVVMSANESTIETFLDVLEEYGICYNHSPNARRFMLHDCPLSAVDELREYGKVIRVNGCRTNETL